MTTPRLLFVCSGNLHRSVMAAAITTAMFEELERPALIASAGTLNIFGRPAPSEVVAVMAELGIDVTGHRSQGLSKVLLEHSDVVIVMSDHHATDSAAISPGIDKKLLYLGDYTDPPGEVWDPIGQPTERFEECRDMILAALQKALPHILSRL